MVAYLLYRGCGPVVTGGHNARVVSNARIHMADNHCVSYCAGKMTVNSRFGAKVAVLAGDFLFAQSSWFLANLDNLEVLLCQIKCDCAAAVVYLGHFTTCAMSTSMLLCNKQAISVSGSLCSIFRLLHCILAAPL